MSEVSQVKYVGKFIPHLTTDLTKPLRQLTEKTVTKWHWEKEHQQAFEKIKHEITKISALAHYDQNKDTILSVDASTIGLGATLWQIDKGESKPIAYHSRKLNQSEKRYAVNELEIPF